MTFLFLVYKFHNYDDILLLQKTIYPAIWNV